MRATSARLWYLSQLQLAEALHQRVVWGVLAAGAALVLAAGVLRDLNFGGAEAHFFLSAARVTLGVTGTVLVALLGPVLVGQGVMQRVAPVFFARGVRRAEWVLASMAALLVAVGWLFILLALALAWVLVRSGHGDSVVMATRALAGGVGPLAIIAAAAVLFACIFERPVPASAATLALAVAGQLAPVLDHVQAKGGVAGVAARALDWVVPDFSFWDAASAGGAVLYAAGFVVLYAIVAVLIFARREL